MQAEVAHAELRRAAQVLDGVGHAVQRAGAAAELVAAEVEGDTAVTPPAEIGRQDVHARLRRGIAVRQHDAEPWRRIRRVGQARHRNASGRDADAREIHPVAYGPPAVRGYLEIRHERCPATMSPTAGSSMYPMGEPPLSRRSRPRL